MDIRDYIENTQLTLAQIAHQTGRSMKAVRKVWETYSASYRRGRKAGCYQRSKLGDLNPMQGNVREAHPRYVGIVGDSKGYLMALKPDWYTGRAGSRHVFLHHIVVCQNMGLTCIPKGWCVHHCNENPHDNAFDNLVLMTVGDHNKWHAAVRAGVTTIAKASTLKWVEAHGTMFNRDDIVYST